MPDAVVIGAGPNGLVAANVLADAGWSVVVLEAEDDPGGAARSAQTTAHGFVHDRFSSFYPFAMLSPVFRRLRLEDHGLRWRRSDVVLAHVRPDGTAAALCSDLEETCARLDERVPGDSRGWRVLMERFRRLRPGIAQAFTTPFPPLVGPARMAAATDPRDLARLVRFLALPVRRMGVEHFAGMDAPDLLTGNALHADLAPEAVGSGAFGWLMCGLAQHDGYPVPEGGASALAQALVRRLEARGGDVRCGQRVERVVLREGRAVAVRTAAGEEVAAGRAVLADVDAQQLYLRLVGAEHLPARVRSDLARVHRSNATVKVDWALDGPIPWRAEVARRAGTVHLAGGVDELTTTLAQLARAQVPSDPFLVMGQYASYDPTRQPPGCETAWAYTHVPQEGRGDAAGELSGRWRPGELQAFADRLQARVEQCAPGFGARVRARTVAGPGDLEAADANLVGGDINGGSAHLHQLALFRPIPAQLGRPRTTVPGLYLASGSAHPSGGVHGAPGANAARSALLHHDPPGLARRALAQRRRP